MAKKKAAKSKPSGRGDASPRLREIKDVSREISQKLETLDIARADQLTAAASITALRAALTRHLNITEQELDTAVAAAKAAAPNGTPVIPVKSFPLGALRPPPQEQAAAYSIPLSSTRTAVPTLPAAIDLVSKMSPVRNQGSRGTCVAFCLTAIHEFDVGKESRDFSERYLYYQSKAID